MITTAEMLSAPKRALLAELWGARVVDLFGMSAWQERFVPHRFHG